MSKEQQKKHIIDMMEKDQELGLYDIFNDEKRQGVKDLIDTHKQRLEKYSERFDNDKSEIGNPDTWGKRIKQETLEEASWKYNPLKKLDGEFLRHAFKEGAKWQQERSYSEEDVYDLLVEWTAYQNGFPRVDEDEIPNGFMSFNRWFEQFKNK